MQNNSQKKLFVIVGPTAVGKTELAIRLADHFQTEIISADSRQFYREMSIGTAKPSDKELLQVKHHFINSHSINELFTAGDFETEALKCLDKIFSHHNTAILVGGSGLFINVIVNGLDNLPKVSQQIRDDLNASFSKNGILPLQNELKLNDPVYFNQVDIHNPQRIMRALEVFRATGKPFSSFQTKHKKDRDFQIIKIGLTLPREILYDRINRRVDSMIENGLVKEAGTLFPFRSHYALQTVGYQELFDYFDGKVLLDESLEKIKQNTRRFAKRQLTWFRRDKEITWFEPGNFEEIKKFAEINSQ